MINLQYLQEMRQGILNELQGALERVQQAKGAIAMLDQLIKQLQQQQVEQNITEG